MENKFLAIDKKYFNKEFKSIELLIIAQIEEFERNNCECYITNEQLSDMFGESISTIKRALSSLETKGIIKRKTSTVSNNGRKSKQRILSISKVQNEPNLNQNDVKKSNKQGSDADKVLEETNSGIYDYMERICYTPSKTRWINEELVYNLTKKIFKGYNVISHHSPSFLISSFGGQMHYDVFIAKLNIAIEYQGKQHFEPVAYFGGEESFKKCCQRDIDKKMLSDKYGVGLVYINYNEEITEQLIKERVVEALKQLA